MESQKRTFVKAVTWQLQGLFVMCVVGYIFTGSLSAGGGIAIAGALTGFIGYIFHERVWQRVKWGIKASSFNAPHNNLSTTLK